MTARCESCGEWTPNLIGPACRVCHLAAYEATRTRRALPETPRREVTR